MIAVILHNVLINIGFYQIGLDYAGKVMRPYGLSDYIKQIVLTLFLANREVIIGPMWYANVLFMALVILALLDWFICLFVKNDNARIVRLIVALCLMLTSSALTNIAGFTIPRFNNTLTAVFLIDLCQFLFRKLKWNFDNHWMFAIATLILLSLPLYGHLSMTNNYFQDPAFLIVVAICGMYVLYYLSQKWGGIKILSFIGIHSFWIMALHFISFKIGSVVLNLFIKTDVSSLTSTASKVFIVAFYLFVGIIIPCLVGVVIKK